MNETFLIFQDAQTLLVVQQIEDFATIDLVESDEDLDRGSILWHRQSMEDVASSLRVDPVGIVRLARGEISTHGECLSRSRLPVGEDRGIAPAEDRLDQRSSGVTIDEFSR